MQSVNSSTLVGIVTCFLDNCGACLQAFALQNTITKMGYPNEIIKFTEPMGYYTPSRENSSRLFQLKKWTIDRNYRTTYNLGLDKKLAFNSFRKKFLVFSKKEYTNAAQLIPNPTKYTCYVCGSDQIWNPSFYKKCNPVYYLSFVDDVIPKIAYAPSIGINDIPREYQEQFRKYINRLDAISVREDKGVELIKKYTNKTAKLVLDPTFLLERNEWAKLAKKKHKRKPYIFCYLFGNHDYYADVIKKFSKKFGLEIRIMPFFRSDIHPEFNCEVNAGPLDFISLVKNAELVLTDSFHASVFSMLFERDFYVLLRDSDRDVKSMNSRIFSLLNLFGLQDRLISQSEVEDIENYHIDNYHAITNRIIELRKDSLEYLSNALKGD